MGFSELIIILVIVLIIFGAGKLPQIGEGVGKALKGFKKEVHDIPPPVEPPPSNEAELQTAPTMTSAPPPSTQGSDTTPPPAQPAYQPGPERTPGTLAAQVYGGFGPEVVQPPQPAPAPGSQPTAAAPYQETYQPPTMEERAQGSVPRAAQQYPPLPQSAVQKPGVTRPAAVVNKEAVARVQAQRAAKQKAQAKSAVPSPDDMQSLGEGLGGTLRTFREATADVRNSIDPEMRTIQAELDAAQKEVEQTIQAAKEPSLPKEPPRST